MAMSGAFGPYASSREASGTAWQPDASIHGGLHAVAGDWMLMGHAALNGVYDWQQGPRGDEMGFVSGMVMGMARARASATATAPVPRDAEPRSADGPARLSAAPRRRRDRRRRHRRSSTASIRTISSWSCRPATATASADRLEPVPLCRPARRARLRPARLHAPHVDHGFARGADHPSLARFRPTSPSASSPPAWSSAISSSRLALQRPRARPASLDIETGPLDSTALRLVLEPDRQSLAAGELGASRSAPEQLEPDENQTRWSASAIYTRPLGDDGWWSTTLAWGRRSAERPARRLRPRKRGRAAACGRSSAAPERTENDELTFAGGHHGPVFDVGKVSLGAIRDFRIGRARPARRRRALCA